METQIEPTLGNTPPQPNQQADIFLPACQVCGRRDETVRVVQYPFVFSVID